MEKRKKSFVFFSGEKGGQEFHVQDFFCLIYARNLILKEDEKEKLLVM